MNQSSSSGYPHPGQHTAEYHVQLDQAPHDQKPGDYGSVGLSPAQRAEEAYRIQRMQRMIGMVEQVLLRERNLPVERASALVADARQAALAMFPGKAQAFNMIPDAIRHP
jgi:hypothetical protein